MTRPAGPDELWSLLDRDDRPVCGVEHEYEVRDAAGGVVDFRALVDDLPLGRRLDPGDPHAHRGGWGGVVTADGREAEVVTPPVPIGAGAPGNLHALSAAGRRFLADRLPCGTTLSGYSTHLSVAVPDPVVRPVADLVVRRFAPALMLLLDRPTSPGLLVRPRPGRLEVCGEYADGRSLRHAVAVVVAAAQLCEDAVRSRALRRALPPRLVVRTEPSRQRFGRYVDRTAFGPDLYATGRAAVLRRRGGGRLTAGEHLRDVVATLGDRLAALLDDDDLASLHAVASGTLQLPLEDGGPLLPDDPPRRPVEALDLRDRTAGGVRIAVEQATWWTYVVRLEGEDRVRWLTVPRTWAGSFLRELDAGRLDGVLTRLVSVPPLSPGAVTDRHAPWRCE